MVPKTQILVEAVDSLDLEIAHPTITKVKEYFTELFLNESFFLEACVFEVRWDKEDLVFISQFFNRSTDLAGYANRGAVIEAKSWGAFVAKESRFFVGSPIIEYLGDTYFLLGVLVLDKYDPCAQGFCQVNTVITCTEHFALC